MDTGSTTQQGTNTVMQNTGDNPGGTQGQQPGDAGGGADGGARMEQHEISTETASTRDIQGELRTAKATLATLAPDSAEYHRFQGAIAGLEWFAGEEGSSLTSALLNYQSAGQPVAA